MFCFKHIQLSKTVKLCMWNNLIWVYKTLKGICWSIHIKYIYIEVYKNAEKPGSVILF